MNDRQFKELITENPMLIEISRFRRKFLSFSGNSALNGIVLGLAVVSYVGLLLLVFSARGAIPPVALIMFQTFIFVLSTPSMLYGAIAGEREKRTWDLLMAAPITKAQIVAGKFMGALVAIGVGFGLFLIPVLVTAVEFERTNWWDTLTAELVSISFIVMIAAVTLFFSARSKRGFMALGTVLGVLAIFLIVCPLLSTVVFQDRMATDMLNFFHPFYVLGELIDSNRTAEMAPELRVGLNPGSWGLPQTLGYFLVSVVFLIWTARTLAFAENDVKFIPKSHA